MEICYALRTPYSGILQPGPLRLVEWLVLQISFWSDMTLGMIYTKKNL